MNGSRLCAPPEAITNARLYACRNRGYFSSGLWSLQFVEVPGLNAQLGGRASIAVDEALRVYFDPDHVGNWTVEQTGGALCHELQHPLRRHRERGRALGIMDDSPEELRHLWNLAADLEINDDIGLPLPQGVALPGQGRFAAFPKGLLAEEYFHLLQEKGIGSQAECGSSCCTGGDRSYELPEPTGAPGKGDDEVGGLTPAQVDSVRRAVASAVRAEGQQAGSVPDGLQRWATSVIEPELDPRTLIDKATRRATEYVSGKNDYTYSRPSRRPSLTPGVVRPSMYAPLPRIDVVIDTSASMSNQKLGVALGVVKRALRTLGRAKVTVRACDADAKTAQRIFKTEDVQLFGGGGTDMGKGIEAACADRQLPGVILVVTDGETPWPDERPARCPHVVAIIIGARNDPPDWIQATYVDERRL